MLIGVAILNSEYRVYISPHRVTINGMEKERLVIHSEHCLHDSALTIWQRTSNSSSEVWTVQQKSNPIMYSILILA